MSHSQSISVEQIKMSDKKPNSIIERPIIEEDENERELLDVLMLKANLENESKENKKESSKKQEHFEEEKVHSAW